MTPLPLTYLWDGESMTPVGRFKIEADRYFVCGRRYTLYREDEDTASDASRRHFFACLNDTWVNLPDALAATFPSADTLRKHALIRGGYCHCNETICGTRAEAQRLASALSRVSDEYAIVTVDRTRVTRLTAKSMRVRGGMNKKEFHEASEFVLGFVADMLGTDITSIDKTEA